MWVEHRAYGGGLDTLKLIVRKWWTGRKRQISYWRVRNILGQFVRQLSLSRSPLILISVLVSQGSDRSYLKWLGRRDRKFLNPRMPLTVTLRHIAKSKHSTIWGCGQPQTSSLTPSSFDNSLIKAPLGYCRVMNWTTRPSFQSLPAS